MSDQLKTPLETLLNLKVNFNWESWVAPWRFRQILLAFPEITKDDVFELINEVCAEFNYEEEEIDNFHAELDKAWDTVQSPDIYGAAWVKASISDWEPPKKQTKGNTEIIRFVRELAFINEPYIFWVDCERAAEWLNRPVPTVRLIVGNLKKWGWVKITRPYTPHIGCDQLRWVLDRPHYLERIDSEPPWCRKRLDQEGPTN